MTLSSLFITEGTLYERATRLRALLLDLSRCDDKDHLLMLPEAKSLVFKFGKQSFIVIRECYPRHFDRIVSRVPLVCVALSGAPGKSGGLAF